MRSPTTTPEDVVTAIATVARPAVAAPVTLIGENGVRGTITPEAIAAALVFRAENGVLVPELNQQVVQDAVAPQMAPSERPGRDATLDFSSGSPVIVPSQDGAASTTRPRSRTCSPCSPARGRGRSRPSTPTSPPRSPRPTWRRWAHPRSSASSPPAVSPATRA
ncbi:hypothetical protein BJF78_34510 [Pseudonocardia sp. CNS-139]|nr:hypothetical protein BJF78_34510 [Pseudonocardia sp. CNS-139]